MSGVIVIANRTKAAKDILSGTIHKLTFWRDGVRRNAVMRLLLRQIAGRWNALGGVATGVSITAQYPSLWHGSAHLRPRRPVGIFAYSSLYTGKHVALRLDSESILAFTNSL